MGKKTGFTAGIIIGALTGAAAALLLTPKAGKENRKWLMEQIDEKTKLRENTEEIISKTKKNIEEHLDHLTHLVDQKKKVSKKGKN